MALVGEWQFIDTTTPMPSANGQVRMNNALQPSATKLWFSRTTATGVDATASLLAITPGQKIRIENKADPSKWQTYNVGIPVSTANYFEYPVIWQEGGIAVPQQRTLLHTVPAGNANIPLDPMPRLDMQMGHVEVKGLLVTPDYAYPFEGKYAISPGLTKRQWYAGQAMIGFISSGPVANLMGGNLAAYCFKAADSMIDFEENESAGKKPPLAGA